MWGPLLMYGLPAALGGLAAYKQSGGNLGAAALGAGLSAGGVKGIRMAGTALAEMPAVAGALGKASSGLTNASTNLAGRAATLTNAANAPGLAGLSARAGASGLNAGAEGLSKLGGKLLVPAAIGTGAATLGGMVLPGIAGNLAASASNPLSNAARGATGAGMSAASAAGVPGFGANPSQDPLKYAQNAITPGLDPEFGAGAPYGSYADAVNPFGYAAAQRLMSMKEMDTQLRNATLQGNLIAKFSEEAKKAELARNLYAATVRGNLATQQQLLLGGVGNARAMGLNAASTIGNAIASQYQYS